MTVAQMRYELKNHTKYSGHKWSHKIDNMSDSQVMAIYFRMSVAGEFLKK